MSDEKTNVDYGSSMQHIQALIKAHVPYIWVSSFEEKRFIRTLQAEVAGKLEHEIWTWSSHGGLIKYEPEGPLVTRATGDLEKTNMPNVALGYIEQYKIPSGNNGAIFLLKDFHTVLAQPIPRQLRDIQDVLIKSKKTLIFLAPCLAHGPGGTKPGLDPTLEKSIVVVPYELPDRNQIESRMRKNITHLKTNAKGKLTKTKLDYTDEEYERFTTAMQGLTEQEAEVALTTCIVHLGKLDERKLLREKKQIVQKSEILEYIDAAPAMADVGGLDSAKKYFDTYSNQFTKEAHDYGVEPLRGVLLTGVPGTGKSLLAKAIAALWNLPLLRLDVGKVMTGLVGGSEEKMRAVIGQVEAIAPCVLWIDEIEKSLSGTKSSNFSDGGTLSRVFGTLLTAMEERMQGVVTIATANDIQALPPELIRRFNEIMFVDLPLESEREEIFRIHLRKRGRDADKLDIDMKELVKATHSYTGSEIEKAVKEAIARAFRTKKPQVGQEELIGAIKDTKPIAKVMSENIDALRTWAREKARYASSLAEEAARPCKQKVRTKGGKELDLESAIDDLPEAEKNTDLATDNLDVD